MTQNFFSTYRKLFWLRNIFQLGIFFKLRKKIWIRKFCQLRIFFELRISIIIMLIWIFFQLLRSYPPNRNGKGPSGGLGGNNWLEPPWVSSCSVFYGRVGAVVAGWRSSPLPPCGSSIWASLRVARHDGWSDLNTKWDFKNNFDWFIFKYRKQIIFLNDCQGFYVNMRFQKYFWLIHIQVWKTNYFFQKIHIFFSLKNSTKKKYVEIFFESEKKFNL